MTPIFSNFILITFALRRIKRFCIFQRLSIKYYAGQVTRQLQILQTSESAKVRVSRWTDKIESSCSLLTLLSTVCICFMYILHYNSFIEYVGRVLVCMNNFGISIKILIPVLQLLYLVKPRGIACTIFCPIWISQLMLKAVFVTLSPLLLLP